MEQFLLDFLGSASGLGAYGLVFGVLLACGMGLPLPEDVALITGGYLAHLGHAKMPIMLAVGFVGILAGDSAVFVLGRMSRKARGQKPGGLLGRHLTPERIARVERQFARRGATMVMIARFLPGVRAATYFVAGGAQMPYSRFVLFDGIAAILSAPLFVLAGWYFGGEIEQVIGFAKKFHNWLIAGMAVAMLAGGLYWGVKRRRRARLAPASLPTSGPELRPVAAPARKDEALSPPPSAEERIAS